MQGGKSISFSPLTIDYEVLLLWKIFTSVLCDSSLRKALSGNDAAFLPEDFGSWAII